MLFISSNQKNLLRYQSFLEACWRLWRRARLRFGSDKVEFVPVKNWRAAFILRFLLRIVQTGKKMRQQAQSVEAIFFGE